VITNGSTGSLPAATTGKQISVPQQRVRDAPVEPGSPLCNLALRVGKAALHFGAITVEPRFVRGLDLDQDWIHAAAVAGNPQESQAL
jgi:hypothetical protein